MTKVEQNSIEFEGKKRSALDEHQLNDTTPEVWIDDLTRLAALYFSVPTALVCLVDQERHWFKSQVGVDILKNPHNFGFCKLVVASRDVVVIHDSKAISHAEKNPIYLGEPGIRFYAGAPLINKEGNVLGTFCVMDVKPRTFSTEQREILASLSRQVIAQIQLRYEQDLMREKEGELQETKAQLELVLKGSNDGWWDRDLSTKKIYFSERTLEMMGHLPSDFPTGTDLSASLFPAKDLQIINQEIREAVTLGKDRFSVELSMIHKKGQLIPFVCRGYITRNKTGWATRISGVLTDLSEFKQARKTQEELQENYRQLFENSMDGVILGCAESHATYAINRAACEMLGRSKDALIVGGRKLYVDRNDLRIPKLLAQCKRDGFARGEMNFMRADGKIFECEVSTVKYIGADGQSMISTIFRDITARKCAEAELRIAASAFESQEGIYVCNADWTVLRVNTAVTRMTGFMKEEVLEKNLLQYMSSCAGVPNIHVEMNKALKECGSWKGEIRTKNNDGYTYPVWMMVTALRDGTGNIANYVVTMTDISDRKKAEEEIRRLAYYDSLTGLPNRRLLLDRLGQALNNSARQKRKGALLFLDLDHFKVLNDTCGHAIGDQLLQQVAQRLVGCAREGDTVARLGGDEFVVMLLGMNEDEVSVATQVKQVGHKILETLNRPYCFGNRTHLSTTSIGATLFGDQRESTDEILKRADLAMYEAKAEGRNTMRFFDANMQSIITDRASLETDLRTALTQGEFRLHYQAQFDVAGNVQGAEVLIRWNHSKRGMVSPEKFISVAEECGLIHPIGVWVLETACRQIALWSANPSLANLTVAVNISGRQLMRLDFVESVMRILHETKANPMRLKLELTESVLVSDVQNTIEKMKLLKSEGVGFSMDDFGTGYSSLAFLKQLPLDQLKIDKGFVRDILVDANDAAIAKMVIALADSLGLSVIAEGVETIAQKEFLAHQGCLVYQGYLFGKPMDVLEFEALLKKNNSLDS